MRIAEEFPCRFTETEDCWIPLPDGVRLAAKLWLPEGAHEKPVPTILEVLPYRKHDQYAPRDAQVHRYFAGHGYASMRSEEHTSELQSLMRTSYAVFCLKKKKQTLHQNTHIRSTN